MAHFITERAKPAELPVERPTNFEFIVNLKAAKQIGLTIPPKCARAGGYDDQVSSGRGVERSKDV
jgi:ABC-type uncharacterized transport system substrate-binding protein